jgi:hypothetical protein
MTRWSSASTLFGSRRGKRSRLEIPPERYEANLQVVPESSVKNAAVRPRRELALRLEALATLAATDLLLTFCPYSWSRGVLLRATLESPGRLDDTARLTSARVLRAFRSGAARYVRPVSCLRRAVALRRLLQRRGVPAVVRFGVRGGERFEAHAWVEVDGAVLGDSERVRDLYTQLPLGAVVARGGLDSLL